MIRDLGSYNTSSSRTHVRFQFSTHSSAGGNVAPNSAFEAADIRIYRAADGAAYSATQRSSANGITMTSPFDSLTGVHDVDIDLTDNTDAGFYAAGYRYSIVLAPDETVDGQTITGVVLGEFEIGPPPANVTQFGGTAGTFSSGRPEVNTTHWAGTAVGSATVRADLINIAGAAVSTSTAQLGVNVVQLSGDSTAADNAEAFFDGTGYAGTNNVIPTVTTVSNAVSANVTQISGDSAAADNLEAMLDGTGSVTLTANITGNITGNLSGSVGSVTGAVGSVTGNVGGNVTGSVGSISGVSFPSNFSSFAITAAGKVTVGTNDDKTGYSLATAPPTANENADALLGRNIAGGSSTGRTVSQALYFIRNKWTISAGTLTVYATDDTTSSWTSAITTTSSNPVTASDPA